MSIEIGRGVKRGARDQPDDISEPSKIVFSMGGDSFYELVESPPLASQKVRSDPQKKVEDGGLRRHASIQAAKRTVGTKQPRSLSEALHKARVEPADDSFITDEAGNTATFTARNTRFARSRPTSAAGPQQQQTPRRNVPNNPTAQSNSFMLPDLPNIAELVTGTRKDGTPLFARTTKQASQSRSRFTSATYNSKPLRPEHAPIESVPVPEDEKAIYASLQLLQDRVAQLESEKSEASKRAEEYEVDLIELRAQLAIAQKRPDSGLGSSAGSGDEDIGAHSRGQAKLQASIKYLQGQLGRSERKTSVADISLQRITKERDELITQIGVAYYNNEELKAENDTFKSQINGLGGENEDLKAEVDALRQENQDLRVLLAQTRASYEDDATRRSSRQHSQKQKKTTAATGLSECEVREAARLVLEQTPRRTNQARDTTRSKRNAISGQTGHKTYGSHGISATLGEPTSDDLAIRIAQEVRKNRDAVSGASQSAVERKTRTTAQTASASTRQRSRSKSQTRPTTAPKQATFTSREHDPSDAESTTQLDFHSLRNQKRASMPTPFSAPRLNPVQKEDDGRDYTELSWMDPNELLNLRRKIEQEYREGKLGGKRATSAPSGDAAAMMSGGLGRKSSMKDATIGSEKRDMTATGGFGHDDFVRSAKTVRVQSPHSSFDAMPQQQQRPSIFEQHTADISMTSNISRRRRRAASAEGMTSAFILPDITLSNREGLTKPAHDVGNCTACPTGAKDVKIPTPVPVTDRSEDIPVDVTSATIRPSQPPPIALATVIKQLEDEIAHLKHLLTVQQRLYNQHDPALSKRRRTQVKTTMDQLTSDIEKRSDQVYSLYDVLEGQKAAEAAGVDVDDIGVEETLESLGIDPAELSGRIGRGVYGANVPFGFDAASTDLSGDLPFEGFSDMGEDSVQWD